MSARIGQKRVITVAAMLADGATIKEIAQRLNLGVNTVKDYAKDAYRAAGVHRREELMLRKRAALLLEADRRRLLVAVALQDLLAAMDRSSSLGDPVPRSAVEHARTAVLHAVKTPLARAATAS